MTDGANAYFSNIICICIFILSSSPIIGQDSKSGKASAGEKYPAIVVDLEQQLSVFDSSELKNARYRIAICADVPDNRRPHKVAYQQESGHVFLLLQKMSESNDTVQSVFGFYPRKGLPTLFFKKISSRIKDNSDREYDVEVSMDLTGEQFDSVLSRSKRYAKRKYHINKYNCYDYALQIFNSVLTADTLALVKVRFPFIFGKGGSPVSIYKEMKRLQQEKSLWSNRIRFGEMRAPVSSGRRRE